MKKQVIIRECKNGRYHVVYDCKLYDRYNHLLTAVSACKLVFPKREIVYQIMD